MLKIVLILMIKNESKILRRCIESVFDFVDAFCITDTGSTDNTHDIALDIIKESSKPGKLCKTIFQDFGTTRSESFIFTRDFVKDLGWDLTNCFGLLLDADMVLKFRKDFDINMLGEYDEYKIIQTQAGFDYNNTRFIRMSLDWKCFGSTHEFWQSDKKSKVAILTSKKVWIDDISDGGCKSDKYERDIRFLNNDLENARKNDDTEMIKRSIFYLGQSYLCIKDLLNAIKYFKLRVELEGWIEEVWYAALCISNCYSMLDDIEESIVWCNKTYDIDRTRSEPLLLLADLYSKKGENEEAMKYIEIGLEIKLNPKNIIFTNKAVYEYSFILSKFIIILRIPTTTKKSVLETAMKLLSKLPTNNAYRDYVVKVINDLSSPLKFESNIFNDDIKGLDYFIEPSLERVKTLEGFLSLEKIGSSYVFIEYGNTKKYSLPFIFLSTPCICRKFYRDTDNLLTFIIQTRDSMHILKLKEEPELINFKKDTLI